MYTYRSRCGQLSERNRRWWILYSRTVSRIIGVNVKGDGSNCRLLFYIKEKGSNADVRIYLGVGKQQLIEIAKAMAKKVELLILDEPTAALNDEESKKLLEIMLELKKQGITCIIISHKLNEISYVADSITVIRDGHTIETLEKGKDDFSEDRIIKGMVGRELTNRYPIRENVKIGDTIFEVKNWNVYHPDDPERQMIKDVNIQVKAGEVVGLAGLMGAGRTELAMSIFGKSYGQKISGQIIISSEMPEIIGTCDRVYVINEGEIAGELNKDNVSQEKIMQSIMAHNRKDDRNE